MEKQSSEQSPEYITDHLKQFAAPLDGMVQVYDQFAGESETPENDQ